MAVALLSELRTRTELILSLPSSDAYVGSATELQDINAAYEKTAYVYNWPQMLIRVGIIITANVDRYPLPTGFRKARHIRVNGILYDETELDVLKNSRRKYAIDRNASQIILSRVPTTASTAYTLSNAEVSGAATVIELDTVTGLSQLDEIFIDSVTGTDEFTLVSSINTTTKAITARLRAAKSANDILYRLKEIIEFWHYRNVVLLSASGDTTILADELDYVIPHYAAYLAYLRLEEFTKAKEHLAVWEDGVRKAFLAQDLNSAGMSNQFVIG